MAHTLLVLLRGDSPSALELPARCDGWHGSRIHYDSTVDVVHEHHAGVLFPVGTIRNSDVTESNLCNFQYFWTYHSTY